MKPSSRRFEVTAAGVMPARCAGHFPILNHFVIGTHLANKAYNKPIVCLIEDDEECGDDGEGVSESLRVTCARAGFGVIHTQMAGDCGIDVMAHFAGLPRTSSSFKGIRRALATFMTDKSAEPMWQRIFYACCEKDKPTKSFAMPATRMTSSSSSSSGIHAPSGVTPLAGVLPLAGPAPPPEPTKSSSSATAASTDGRPMPALPPPPVVPPPPLPVPPVPPQPLAPPPLPPPPLPPPDSPTASSAPSDLIVDAPKTFILWLRTVDAVTLGVASENLEAFRLAEQDWRQSHPCSKPSRRSKRHVLQISRLDHRIAVGMDFQQWCKNHVAECERHKYVAYARSKWDYDKVPNKLRVWLSRCEGASVKAVANHAGVLPSGRLAKAGGTESWDVGMIRMRVFVDLNSSRLDIQCLVSSGFGRVWAWARLFRVGSRDFVNIHEAGMKSLLEMHRTGIEIHNRTVGSRHPATTSQH